MLTQMNICLHLSVYINLNDKVHQLGHSMSKSSWDEYIGGSNYSFCDKDIVLDQFNKTEDYEVFANDSLEPIMKKKKWKIFCWNNMDIINLEKILKDKDEKPYRLKQIKKAVFVDLINNWDEATTLSKELREELSEKFTIASLELLSLLESKIKIPPKRFLN